MSSELRCFQRDIRITEHIIIWNQRLPVRRDSGVTIPRMPIRISRMRLLRLFANLLPTHTSPRKFPMTSSRWFKYGSLLYPP